MIRSEGLETARDAVPEGLPSGGIKGVPPEPAVRERIRVAARDAAARVRKGQPPTRLTLMRLAASVLGRLGLNGRYLGFAMVAVDNAFWRDQFAGVQFSHRLLLLPHCLRDPQRCAGIYEASRMICRGCGACLIGELQQEAETLGYRILIAEGTPAVVQTVLTDGADAILGVACLDSLDQAFDRISELGIPHANVPLLRDGCRDTVAEPEVIRSWMRLSSVRVAEQTRSYVPLLRAARGLFASGPLETLLEGHVPAEDLAVSGGGGPAGSAGAIAINWLTRGGKRFRPFVTLASYAALAHGEKVFRSGVDAEGALPLAVKRVAVAMEALHKASLVHDDIQDDDNFRYGSETLHRSHGMPVAMNVGDYLIGLGYHLVGASKEGLGSECVADILKALSDAHLRLCRGQGTELAWRDGDRRRLRPADVQRVYALKTAPAFEVSMYAGVRMARAFAHGGCLCGVGRRAEQMRLFSRYVGAAYQVLNDLKDWDLHGHDKVIAGQDLLSGRPTILLAFALAAGDEDSNAELLAIPAGEMPEQDKLEQMRRLYRQRGVFDTARSLVSRYRKRAEEAADDVEPPALRELMHFIVDMVL